jgi:hypothetical protein
LLSSVTRASRRASSDRRSDSIAVRVGVGVLQDAARPALDLLEVVAGQAREARVRVDDREAGLARVGDDHAVDGGRQRAVALDERLVGAPARQVLGDLGGHDRQPGEQLGVAVAGVGTEELDDALEGIARAERQGDRALQAGAVRALDARHARIPHEVGQPGGRPGGPDVAGQAAAGREALLERRRGEGADLLGADGVPHGGRMQDVLLAVERPGGSEAEAQGVADGGEDAVEQLGARRQIGQRTGDLLLRAEQAPQLVGLLAPRLVHRVHAHLIGSSCSTLDPTCTR